MTAPPTPPPVITIARAEKLRSADLHDLCDAAEAAIRDGGGFGWLTPPPPELMERYWRGVVLIPERVLLVGRIDGVIGGAVQLFRPPANNEAQAHAATLTMLFVTPWARRHHLGEALVCGAIEYAHNLGAKTLNLDVRETQQPALALFEKLGFVRWGRHPRYAEVGGAPIAGYYLYCDLNSPLPHELTP